jgi:hypothetical protein
LRGWVTSPCRPSAYWPPIWTLIGSTDEFHLYGDFEELLVQLRAKFGTAWAVCTGRRHRSFLRMMGPLRTLGLLPDYVIVRHAYIYKQTRWGYVPHVAWNVRIMLHVMLSRLHIREAINEWYGLLSKMCTGSTVISKTKTRLCLRFENEEDADAAERMLREKVTEFTHLCVFRFMREVDVRLVPFTKGLALGDLADGLGVAPVARDRQAAFEALGRSGRPPQTTASRPSKEVAQYPDCDRCPLRGGYRICPVRALAAHYCPPRGQAGRMAGFHCAVLAFSLGFSLWLGCPIFSFCSPVDR